MSIEFVQSTQELEHKIVIMHLDGWSIRSLSRHFHLGRNRVRRIIRNHCRRRDEGTPAIAPPKGPIRTSKLDAFQDQIVRLLEKYPDITAIRMREELVPCGYDGGITILRERLQRLRPLPKREPVVRFETDPGVQGQMDWSPYTIEFSRSGKTTVLCFSYILGFSAGSISISFCIATSIRSCAAMWTSSGISAVRRINASMITKKPSCCAMRLDSRCSTRPSSTSSPITGANPLRADPEGPRQRGRSRGRFNTWKEICSHA